MGGFGKRKDGKFYKKTNSSRTKTIGSTKSSGTKLKSRRSDKVGRDTHRFFRTFQGLGQDWAYMKTSNSEDDDTIADGSITLYDLEDNEIETIKTVNFIGYIQDLNGDMK